VYMHGTVGGWASCTWASLQRTPCPASSWHALLVVVLVVCGARKVAAPSACTHLTLDMPLRCRSSCPSSLTSGWCTMHCRQRKADLLEAPRRNALAAMIVQTMLPQDAKHVVSRVLSMPAETIR